jgi:transcriptional regulator with XRE-family HTH domain
VTGAELKAIRRDLGLTQAQVARLLGVHPNTVACWERDVKPIGKPLMVQATLRQRLPRPPAPPRVKPDTKKPPR